MDLFDGDIEQIAIERIRTFEPPEGYYVAYSGGKDSDVILDLVKRSGVKFDAHMNLTSVDPPEVLKYVKQYHPEVERHRPEKTMFQLIPQKHMPPTRIVRYCCEQLKEKGGKGRFVVTGIRRQESRNRANRQMVDICGNRHKRFLHPIVDWSASDVWHYIRSRALPYCKLYDEGYNRIGCICCPMSDIKRDGERWPQYKKAYLKSFQKLIEKRKIDDMPCQWETADEVWKWWITRKKTTDENQQCFIYDN